MSPVRRIVWLVSILSVTAWSAPATAQSIRALGGVGRAGAGLVNRRPVADAGRDRTAAVGSVVRLDGSRSSDADGDRLAHRWSLAHRPAGSQAALTGAATFAPSFVADAPGRYVVRLAVSDGRAFSDADEVVIDTRNSAPHADAGPGQTVAVGATAHLSAAASVDVDGDRLTYAWVLVAAPRGSRAALSNPTSVTPALAPDRPGRYVARVVASDGMAFSEPADVTIDTRNSAPESRAAAPARAAVGDVVTLDGTGSTDLDGDRLAYRWALTSRPASSAATVSDATAARATVTIDRPGLYVAQLVTGDGIAEGAPSTVVIATTTGAVPVARIAPGTRAVPGQVAVLDASGSDDADGDALSYRWSWLSRPPASQAALSDPSAVMPNFVVDQPGVYVAQLIVNDGENDSLPATVTLVSPMAPPVAVPAVASIAGRVVTLDGSASFDPDGSPLTYAWSLIGAPAGSTATLSSATAVAPTFVMDKVGTYVAQLIVDDGSASSAPATTPANLFPVLMVANAGPDQFLDAVNVTVQLQGSGTATAQTYAWSFVSVPSGSTATLSNAAIAAPTFTADVAGDYVLQLVVGDGVFTSLPDQVVIHTDRAGLRFLPARLTLAPGGAGALTLSLPAGTNPNGLFPIITLTSSDPAAASVPATVQVPFGQTSVSVPVTAGAAVGAAIITASAPGLGSARAVVGVGANIVEWAVDASGSWNTAANWSGGAVPTAGDIVLIDRPAGAFTVTVAQPAAVRALLSFEALTVTGGLTVSGDATFGPLQIASPLSVGGRATVAGPAQWLSGTVTGGQFEIETGQTLAIQTAASKVIGSGSLTNHGTVAWNDGTLFLQGNSAILNAVDGVWDIQSNLTMTSSNCGAPTFMNAGTLRKSGGVGAFTWGACVVATNTGLIEILSGSVVVGSSLTTNGQAVLATGTSFALDKVTLNAGATFAGAGTLLLNGSTVANSDIVFAVPTTMTGTLSGSGKAIVDAPFTWSAGTLVVTGGLDVPTGRTLTMSGAGSKVLDGVPLVNSGTVVWQNGTLFLQSNTPVTNAAGAMWDVQGDLTLTSSNCGAPTFTNAGTLRKSSGAGAFTLGACVAASSSGTLEIATGSVNVASTLSVTGLVLMSSGTTFSLNRVTLNVGASFSGGGTLFLDGATVVNGDIVFTLVTSQSGTVSGAGRMTVAAPFTWASGATSVTGGIVVPAGQTLHLQTAGQKVLDGVPLVNQGTVSWSDGTLFLQSNAPVTNAALALWDVRGDLTMTSSNCGAPTFANAGLVRKSVGTGAFNVTSCVVFSNTGTVDIQTGTMVVGSTLTSSGLIAVAAGSTVSLNHVTLASGATFSGNGALALDGSTVVNTTVVFSLATTQTGVVSGIGGIIVAAPFTWTSGTMAMTDGIQVPPGETLLMSGTASKVVDGVPFLNQGTVTWTGGSLFLQGNSALTNATGALFDVQGNLTLTSSNCGAPTFLNAGTLRRSAGTFAFTIGACVAVTNTGTIDIQVASFVVNSSLTTSGHFRGALTIQSISLNNYTLQGGATFGGLATLVMNGTTTVTGTVTMTVPLTLSGNAVGSGKLIVDAPLNWGAGTMALAGGLELNAGRTLIMGGAGAHVLDTSSFTNRGTVTWTSGTMLMQGNAAITNAVGAVWNAQGDLSVSSSNCGSPTFANAGTLRKSAGSGSLAMASCVVTTNTGTIDLQIGTFTATNLVNTGLISVAAGTTFNLDGATLQAGSTFSGAGRLVANGNTTISGTVTVTVSMVKAGTITGSGTLVMAAPMEWQSGAITLTGGLVIGPGRTLSVFAGTHTIATTVTNQGLIEWNGGAMFLQGNSALTNAAGGTLEVRGLQTMTSSNCGAPVFSNAGLVHFTGGTGSLALASCVSFTNTGIVRQRLGGNAAGTYDTVTAGGVTLGGTLDVVLINGFVPTTGQTFDVMSYTARTGTFAVIDDHGQGLTSSYGATALQLAKP